MAFKNILPPVASRGERKLQILAGKWTGRFIWASVVQGFLAVVWTLFIIDPYVAFSPSRGIAGGEAGTWFFVGYVMYILVGVIAVAVTAMFYFYIESVRGKAYRGLTSYLAWAHIVLMNVGASGAAYLLMYGGYLGGVGQAPTSSGGGGLGAGQIHVQILGALVNPIGYFVAIAVLGVLAGGLGYVIASRRA